MSHNFLNEVLAAVPLIVYCTSVLTSLSDSVSYITLLFLEWRMILWIYSGLNRVSVKRTEEVYQKEFVFNIFTHRFAYFGITIANAKIPKTMLTEYIPSVFLYIWR